MDKVTTVGIDLAKQVFALHEVNTNGKTLLRRAFDHAQSKRCASLLSFFDGHKNSSGEM